MKIVHIEDFFHPNAGYQINILAKYMVKQGHDITIITAEIDKIPENLTKFFGRDSIHKDDQRYMQETGVKIIRLPIKAYISGRVIFGKILDKTVQNLNPDILYVHGNDTVAGIQYILKSNKLKFPIITDSHMLEMASTNKFNKIYRMVYKRLVTPKIIKNKIKVIRTQDDPYVEKCLGIPLKLAPWISVGSDTMLFHPDNKVKAEFRKELNIAQDDFVVVYTGKLDESKGGKLLASACKDKLINDKNKKVIFIIVGNTVGEYGEQVENLFKESQNKIIRFSTQKYVDLAKFYQVSDLCVFPRQCSLSFYDAQACGLPVVSEDNHINVDRLRSNNGLNFECGDEESLRNKIVDIINMGEEKQEEMKLNAYNYVKSNYNYENIAEEYMNIINEEYKNRK